MKTKEKERIDKASESKDGIPMFFSKLASKANKTLTVVLVLNLGPSAPKANYVESVSQHY